MKKRNLLALLLVLALAVSLLAGCSGKDSAPAAQAPEGNAPAADAPDDGGQDEPKDDGQTWKLNLGTSTNDPASANGFSANGRATQAFADLVRDYTDGRVDIACNWGSVLGTNVTMFEEVQMGTLDFHQGQPMSSADVRFACWSLPFNFTTYDQIWEGTKRDGGKIFELADKWMAEDGVKLLAMGIGNLRGFVSNIEVRVPEDARVLKIRTYEDELVNMYWGSIGTPAIIGMADMYSALQTKTVDALEMFPSGVILYKFYELAKFYAPINWQWTCGSVLTCPMSLWESFPADIQDAIQKAADEYAYQQYQGMVEDDSKAFDAMRENGMTIAELTDEEMQAWYDSGAALKDDFREYIGAEVYDEYMAVVDEVLGR